MNLDEILYNPSNSNRSGTCQPQLSKTICREGKYWSLKSGKWMRMLMAGTFFFIGIMPSSFFQSAIAAEITLPYWVSDNMMLPVGTPFKISGMAEPRKTVYANLGSVSASVNTDDCGSWTIEFPAVVAGIKGDLEFVCSSEKKVIHNVAAGDTWLCAGQSNMQRSVANSDASQDAEKDILKLDIRYFDGKSWKKITEENVKNVSAVAVYFAIEMARRQHLPFGIFIAARGGTGIDAWIPGDAFPDTKSGRYWKTLINDPEVLKAAEEDRIDFKPFGQQRLARWGLGRAVPASLFGTLILPYSDLPVRGVVWYQGENNAGSIEQAKEYHLWLKNLINEYRRLWGNPELLFAIIQLPSFDPGTKEGRIAWSKVQGRQARVVRQTKHTELVRIKDLGDLKDIHPHRKKEVGKRTADAAWKLIQNYNKLNKRNNNY